MDRGDGGDAQGVTLASSYGEALVECGALGGLQFGGAEEVGDLARHVKGNRQFRGRGARIDGRAVHGRDRGLGERGQGGKGSSWGSCAAWTPDAPDLTALPAEPHRFAAWVWRLLTAQSLDRCEPLRGARRREPS